MKEIAAAIKGGSLLISGTIILNLVLAGMDWRRIGEYGLFNELGNAGIAPLVFIVGLVLMIIGCVFIGASSSIEEEEKNKKSK